MSNFVFKSYWPTHLYQNTDNANMLGILISVRMLHGIVHTTIYNWIQNTFTHSMKMPIPRLKIHFKHVSTCNERIFSAKMIHILMIWFFFLRFQNANIPRKVFIMTPFIVMNYTLTHTHTHQLLERKSTVNRMKKKRRKEGKNRTWHEILMIWLKWFIDLDSTKKLRMAHFKLIQYVCTVITQFQHIFLLHKTADAT